MNQSNVHLKTKLLVSLLLVFAGIVDLLLGQWILNKSMGLAPIFLVLAAVFILQDAFQWIRIASLILMTAVVAYRAWLIILNLFDILEQTFHRMTRPAAIPLYIVLSFIGVLCYLIIKTDKIIQHRK